MNKLKWITLIIGVLGGGSLQAQQFQSPLDPGFGRLNTGTSIIELSDNSLVISSSFDEDGVFAPEVDLNITRLSPDSSILWSKDFFFEQPINTSVVREWSSENALLVSVSLTNFFSYKVLLKIDLEGNILWSRRYGNLDDFFGVNLGRTDVIPLDDGTAILAGGAQSIANSDNNNDLYVGKVDADGDLIWGKNYCFGCLGEFEAIFSDIQSTPDGGFIISGGLKSTEPLFFNPRTRLLLVKIDADGELEWTWSYYSTSSPILGEQIGFEVAPLPNGNYLVAGVFDDFAGESDGLLIEVGQNGEYIRALTANIPGTFYDVTFDNLIVLDNNTTVVSGSAKEQTSPSQADVFNFMARIQLNGLVNWSYNYVSEILVGLGTDANDIIELSNGGYGYVANFHTNFEVLYPFLILTDEDGETGCEEPLNFETTTDLNFIASLFDPPVVDNTTVENFEVSNAPFSNFNFSVSDLDIGPDTLLCDASTLELDATISAPATYEWNTGQTTPVITIADPDTYIVTVTVSDGNDCFSVVDSIIVDQLVSPEVSFDTTICQGQTVVFEGEVLTQTGIYTAAIPGIGCDTIVTLELNVLPVATATIDTTICSGESVTIGGETYFSPGAYTQNFQTGNECDSILTINVSFFPGITDFIEQLSANCSDNTVTIASTSGSSFEWSTGETTQSISVAAPGIYTLSITDDNNCQNTDTIDVAPLDIEQLNLELLSLSNYNGFEISCPEAVDGNINIEADGGEGPYVYSWSNGDVGSSLSDIGSGIYSVTATDSNGCIGIDTLTLNAPPAIDYDLQVEASSCFDIQDGTIAFVELMGGIGPFLYTLNDLPFQSEPLFSNLVPDTYQAKVQDANGCELVLETVIPSPPVLSVDLGPDQLITLGERITLRAQNNLASISTISWVAADSLSCLDCLNPIITPIQEGIYQVTLTDENGCKATDEVLIRILPDRSVYIPNAFSPNGDGRNDFFNIFVGNSVQEVEMLSVYNRWGGLVFQSRDIEPNVVSDGWNGQIGGQLAPVGVYAYVAQVKFIDGREEVLMGEVNLIR
jgi:gliding motility-associated-like protein